MKRLAFFIFPLIFLAACSSQKGTPKKKEKEQLVLISTEMGEIKLKLYNETPAHRDNFIKLVKESFYDDLLFHRVIKNFMIQGGDPDSKVAKAGQQLGRGGNGYTLPAEFVKKYYHKKGALAAARQPDSVNPKKASSGCQFYIVVGETYSSSDLDKMLATKNKQMKEILFQKYLNREDQYELYSKYEKAQKNRDRYGIKKIREQIQPIIDEQFEASGGYKFTPEQIESYTTIGGYPSLDGDYTVFGEVVEGLDVLDKIGSVQVARGNRPIEDIRMTVRLVKE